MQTASRDLGAPGRSSRSIRARATVVVVGGLGALLLLGVVESAYRIIDLDRRRDEALVSEFELPDVAGDAGDALRRLRPTLAKGDRFALVFGPGVTSDDQGTYRLVSQSYLYPAIATSEPERADAVIVFGAPGPSIRESFGEIDVVNGVWLGRRSGE